MNTPRTIAALAALACSGAALAGGISFTDFEPAGFVDGTSLQAHAPDGTIISPIVSGTNPSAQAWSIRQPGTDEEIVDISGSDPSHGKVWRFSDLANPGNLQTRPHAPRFLGQAGETGAIDDFGGEAVTTDTWYGQVDFRSATGGAQPGLEMYVAAACGDDCRHGYVIIIDDGAGFDLGFYETGDNSGSMSCGSFPFTLIDLNLDYGWHTLGIAITFVDGFGPGGFGAEGNDIVEVSIDGSVVHVGTSWETCYAYVGTGDPRSVDRMVFSRSSSGAADPGGGLYFDNVLIDDEAPAAPASIALVADDDCVNAAEGTFTVDVTLAGAATDVVGGQLFLAYDDAVLSVVDVSPGDPPFTEEIYEDVSTSGAIDYAVGTIVPALGATDGVLARITFSAVGSACDAAGLVSFRSHVPPTRVTDAFGAEVASETTDLGAITVDVDPPAIACPADATVECDQPPTPATVLGATGPLTGGFAVYYNATGPADLSNAAYLQSQVTLANDNGAEFFFDTSPLTGLPLPTWESIFSGVFPSTQFGLDIIRPLPTADGSVLPPSLTAVDNNDSTPAGATPVGVVSWAMNDYKGPAPSGPTSTLNLPTNSLLRPLPGGDPMVDIEIVELSLTGTTLTVAGRLASDGAIHWFNPAFGTGAAGDLGLTGDYWFSGTFELDSSVPGVDFFAGSMEVVANAPVATGFATATDDCTLFPAVTFSDAVTGGACPDALTITRTWTATDDCGNVATCDQIIEVVDTTAPTIQCPPDITVNADAGGCTASAATVNVVAPTVATDNCDPGPVIAFDGRSDSAGLGDPYPAGTTTITWSATDACGNVGFCEQLVTVNAVNELAVTVELAAISPGPLDRCITFELWTCAPLAGPVAVDATLTFTGSVASAVIEVPCGDYDCITARDKRHTLRRTDVDDFGISGTQYVADFTNSGGDDDALPGGNLNDDPYVDILDFGVYVGEFTAGGYGTPDTNCATPFPHADISGDAAGDVDTFDFTFIQINFLTFHEANCCGQPAATMARANRPAGAGADDWMAAPANGPVVRIAVSELRRRGLDDLVVADLNRDGWLDPADVAAFAAGARP